MAVIQQGFHCKIEEKDKISAMVNVTERLYTDTYKQEQDNCGIKSVPVTSRGLIKAIHETYCLKGGQSPCVRSGNGVVEDDGHETALVRHSSGKRY